METNGHSSEVFSYDRSDISFEAKAHKDFTDRTASGFDALLDTKWQDAMNKGMFRFAYDPNMPAKRLSGKFGFFLEVNGERHSTRRAPPVFASTREPLDPSRFHFGRAPVAERIFRLSGPARPDSDAGEQRQRDITAAANDEADADNDTEVDDVDEDKDDWVVINVSPIGRSHVLLVPRLSQLLPQRLRKDGLQTMLHCLLLSQDSGLRGLFNSIGALASVNHYHHHLYRLPQALYIETAEVQPIGEDLYEFTDYPARAFVFEVNEENLSTIARRVVALSELILDRGLAYNLVAARGHPCDPHRPRQTDVYTALRVMVWPRLAELPEIPRKHFQVASCELAGHAAVTSSEALEVLTEDTLAEALRDVTESAFEQLRPLVADRRLWDSASSAGDRTTT